MTRLLKKILSDTLDEAEIAQLVSAFDQIGSIIIIRIPSSLYPRRHLIGEMLLSGIKVADRVFCQVTKIDGDWRTRGLELIAGSGDDTVTRYRENGCVFDIDVKKVFFTPRLATERRRVSEMVRSGETVLNMFGGAGPYSIQMARRVMCVVYNVDINPYATLLCRRNISLNKLIGIVMPITANARDAAGVMSNMMDRTVMSLPERAESFLDYALLATKSGGVIHYYTHVHADHKHDAVHLAVSGLSGLIPKDSEILDSRLVRPVGPRYYQTAVDIQLP